MLELAIVLPILLMLVLGIIEMGRVMMLNQVATNASREGCRQAVVPGATNDRILQIVNAYLDASHVKEDGRGVEILDENGQPVDLQQVGSRQRVTVRVSFPYANNTLGFTAIMGAKQLSNEVSMRRE